MSMDYQEWLAQLRRGAWTASGAVWILVVVAAFFRPEEGLSPRSNTSLLFMAIGSLALGVYYVFLPDLGWKDRVAMIGLLTGGGTAIALSEGLPGIQGRGFELAAPVVVVLLIAVTKLVKSR